MGSSRSSLVKTGPNQYKADGSGRYGLIDYLTTPIILHKGIAAANNRTANRTAKPNTGGALISKSTPSPEWRRQGRLSLLNANQETVGGQKRTLG
jgi:hypothetical protein